MSAIIGKVESGASLRDIGLKRRKAVKTYCTTRGRHLLRCFLLYKVRCSDRGAGRRFNGAERVRRGGQSYTQPAKVRAGYKRTLEDTDGSNAVGLYRPLAPWDVAEQ